MGAPCKSFHLSLSNEKLIGVDARPVMWLLRCDTQNIEEINQYHAIFPVDLLVSKALLYLVFILLNILFIVCKT